MDSVIEEESLFWQYPVITEKTFYDQNKEDPMYLGIPWATILDKRYKLKYIEEKVMPLLTKKVYYSFWGYLWFWHQ